MAKDSKEKKPTTEEMYGVKAMSEEEYFKKYINKEGKPDKSWIEIGKDQMMEVSYRKPEHIYRLIFETFSESIEEAYFWLLNYIRYDVGFSDVDKITDVFSASEHSSFFGIAQQRIGLQQDKVSQFLGVIGKMVKELFQLVRELRILDERMNYYENSMDPDVKAEGRESAEITLKGIWVDLVEQGGKNPASVYGMARELQFTTLPDLFYSIHPPTPEKVDEYVDRLDFNRKLKEVLKRKLRTYLEWKRTTYSELKNKRIFTLKYLRQHFDVIRMYMSFVRPYLKNILRLQVNENSRESPDLIAAFEGSTIEIEILGKSMARGNENVYSCVLLHFDYRTKPSMNYTAEGYNRGPIHVGEIQITLRLYGWTQEEIDDYKALRNFQDLELLSIVDASVKAAMEALGDELFKYLKEAGERIGMPAEKSNMDENPKSPSVFEPFTALVGGFKDMFTNFVPVGGKSKGKPDKEKISNERKKATGSEVKMRFWLCYKNFKKSHKMITW